MVEIVCSWIYHYMYNQCLSPLKLWVQIPSRWGLLDTTLCYNVCQWLAAGRVLSFLHLLKWCHDITAILLKVAINTITFNPFISNKKKLCYPFVIKRKKRLYIFIFLFDSKPHQDGLGGFCGINLFILS